MTTLTIDQLQKWYKKQLAKRSKEFIKRAEKSYKVVEHTLKDIEAVSRELKVSEDDDPESEGIVARFAQKISEIVQSFELRKDVSYANTETMQEEIQHFIQELWGAGARWIRRMDKRYKSTIKTLDMYMKELAREMKKISKLLYEFSWVKDLERIGGRISTLRDLTLGKELFEEQIRQIQLKIDHAQQEYAKAKAAYDSFVESSNVSELLHLDEEAERLSSLLRMKLNLLKKPVKKLLQQNTGVRIGAAGQKALTDYFEDPLAAIVEDGDGLPALLEGLAGLKEAIETNKLKIKDRLARRALEEIEAIKNGSLNDLQAKARALAEKRRVYADSDVYGQHKKLSDELEEARMNLEYHKNDLLRVRDEILRRIDKVEEFRERIEAEILESFGEKVIIKIDDLGFEPLLEQCTV